MRPEHRISLCTVCMNRLAHLKQTLPQNIIDNLEYGNIEFVVLNYNSTDQMEEWFQQNMGVYVQMGIVKYYRTTEPKSFDHSKSRNMALRLAQGDIICNIDADNFTGKGFAQFIADTFAENENCFIRGDIQLRYDLGGRICMWKKDFNLIKGFDESMLGYGYEDDDLVNRLLKTGRKQVTIEDLAFQKVISHTNRERLQNDPLLKEIDSIYINYQTYYRSAFLILLNDSTFVHETVIDNLTCSSLLPGSAYTSVKSSDQYSLDTAKGIWQMSNNEALLLFDTNQEWIMQRNIKKKQLEYDTQSAIYHMIEESSDILRFAFFYSQLTNLVKCQQRKKNTLSEINPDGFGKGIVFKNFEYSSPICL